jgi:hypothetical protein
MGVILYIISYILVFFTGVFLKDIYDFFLHKKLNRIGKLKIFFQSYMLSYLKFYKGSFLTVLKEDDPNASNFEIVFDLYNPTDTDRVFRDIWIIIKNGKKKFMTEKSRFGQNGFIELFSFITLKSSEQIRVYCNPYFIISDLVTIAKGSKLIISYFDGKRRIYEYLTTLESYHDKDGNVISL